MASPAFGSRRAGFRFRSIIVDGDPRSFARRAQGDRAADTLGAAGYNNDTSC
jgi:hypothetical protein